MKHPFPPVVPQGARVMVLGTFPSEASVKAGGYYGHPHNAFWPIMAEILETPWLRNPPGWATRYMALRLNRIALWDIFATCEREDPSSDQGMKVVTPNDVWNLIARLPEIRGVILNGRAAWDGFREWTQPYLRNGIRVFVCPSTSARRRRRPPARPAWSPWARRCR